MRKILILLAVFCLSSCYLFRMDENLKALYGQPVEVAFQALGLPDGTFNVRGLIIYVWGRSQSYSYRVPQQASTTGLVGMTPFNYTTSYDSYVSGVSRCKIKIATNSHGTIVFAEYDGGWMACDVYAERLDDAFRR